MQLREFLRGLRADWYIVLISVLLLGGAAAAYSFLQTPVYMSTSKVFVSTQSANSVSELTQGGTYTQQLVKSYADVATSPIVLQPVIEQLGLDETPRALASRVSASAPLNTVVIEISASDPSPERAAAIADSISRNLAAVVPEISPAANGQTSPVKLTQIEAAAVSSFPVSPRKAVNIGLGVLVGLGLGIGISALRRTLDVRIRGSRDVELVTDRPVLGRITRDPVAAERPLIVQDDSRSARAEAFRTLRTNLQFLDFGRGSRVMVVTSAVEGEGKSTTAANLAIAIADSGLSVLVIDADLRQPRLADYLGIDGGVGLTDVLIGNVEVDDAVQPWGDQKMAVLPAGEIPPNPSELLQSPALSMMLTALKKKYGTIIIDAPPLLPVSDGSILARRASGAIVVSSVKRSSRQQLQRALAVLDQVDAKTLGVVLTRVPLNGPDAIGATKYGYGGGKGNRGRRRR